MIILNNYHELYAFFFGNDFEPSSDDVIGKVQVQGELLGLSYKYENSYKHGNGKFAEVEFGDEGQSLTLDENGVVIDCCLYYY
jgi:hypothetical protein